MKPMTSPTAAAGRRGVGKTYQGGVESCAASIWLFSGR
jgi:hypothetical protein